MMPRRSHVLVMLALLGLPACRNQNTIVVPNRVLDRPLDVTLACVRRDGDDVTVLALNQCDGAGVGDCDDEGVPQLIGFVANSDKNEVGMFRRCDVNGMVDLDPQAPGYNLVPVGTIPSRIVQTPDCRVVTANAGSCDFSAIDGPALASYAVGLSPSEAPSALVSTIRPLLSDGTPLGSSPGDMIAVPRALSLAGEGEDPEGGTVDLGSGACDPDRPASVYVTFPQCQLVAEVSLGTQRILQSRQFVTDEDGAVSMIDAGPDPECPIECPAQFDGDIPDRSVVIDDMGVFPMALALVEPFEGDDPLPEDDLVTFPSLFVGGTGSDEVFEIELLRDPGTDAALGFAPTDDLRRLRLEQPAGVSAIRPTLPMFIDGEPHQFLYVIAGDGSTHVVDRVLDGTVLGVECDTQVDPSQATSRACHPIDPDSQGGLATRRPFAAGPGIRGSDGSTITDWTFERTNAPSDPGDVSRSPLGQTGVVGVGVTSFGRVVLAVFSHYDGSAPTIPISTDGRTIDPIGLLNVEIRPHMLWPVTDPESGEPSILPLVDDDEPDRVLSGEDNISQVLAPAMRRIDRAYFATGDDDFSDEQRDIWMALGNPENIDRLGGFDDDALYENNVTRVAVRDYRQWRNGQTWSIEYEPQIPGTESATGRILCENPGPNGEGTCHAGDDPAVPDIELIDEGATFCDEGVLPGDKLVLFGCSDDDSCGVGRRCLRDPNVAGSTSGICVSAQAYEDNLEDLRAACAPFVTNPCGQPRREYTITSATQTNLTFVPTDIPPTTFFLPEPEEGDPPAECPFPKGIDNLRPGSDPDDLADTNVCVAELRDDDTNMTLLASRTECEARLTCAGIEQPTGGCAENSDCTGGADGADYVCFDGLCRTPCEGGSFNCRQTPLPGPGCFGEFVRYAATLRESLGVSVDPAARFMTDRVITDPDTGECREDPTISTLLTSRIPLGPDQATTLATIPYCTNADDAAPSDPNPCLVFDDRAGDPESLYHRLSYETVPIEAIRYSNPFGTIVIDLVSALDVAAPNDLPGQKFSDCFAEFRRARIPRNYRESFSTPNVSGYQAYNDPIVVGSTPLTYPVRVVSAPEVGAVFAVDAGGRGGAAGVRGQVVRIEIREGVIRGDEQFRVR